MCRDWMPQGTIPVYPLCADHLRKVVCFLTCALLLKNCYIQLADMHILVPNVPLLRAITVVSATYEQWCVGGAQY